jgi:glycosyltransferase involved in cell wall biosynthesis
MACAWHGRGHQVEVFTASHERSGTEIEDGIVVHRIQEPRPSVFGERIAPVFAARHAASMFDVLEGPEYGADARGAVELVPDIPLVVRLRTPTYLAAAINAPNPGLAERGRKSLGRLRRCLLPCRRPITDRERIHTTDADEVVAPSRAIRDRLLKDWDLAPERLSLVPYPYHPSAELLHIPIETRTGTITFVGRLEIRKGVLDLAAAIPGIIRRHPNIKIRFVGNSSSSPDPDLDMRQYLERVLAPYRTSIQFTGPVAPHCVPRMLASTDICVFPSVWESFGFVCLEAMAAGRGVVASSSGGMAELLNGGEVGRLVAPHHPQLLAAAVNELLDAPSTRMQLGRNARERVLREYTVGRFIDLQGDSYRRAIARRRKLGSRQARRSSSRQTVY